MTTSVVSEVSSSVQIQSTKNSTIEVVKVKKHSTKTFTRSKSGYKSESEETSKSGKNPKIAKVNKQKKQRDQFPPTVCEKKVRKLLEKQPKDNPTYIEGNLRINTKYSKHAYLALPGSERDILIIGVGDRNRALDGDLVAAIINPEEKWFKHPTGEIQKTGVVVCILEKVHPRKAVGFIKNQQNGVLFYPRDSRIPLLRIVNLQLLPVTFHNDPNAFKDILFLCVITLWKKPGLAFGSVCSEYLIQFILGLEFQILYSVCFTLQEIKTSCW